MILNEWGRIARDEWQKTETIRDNVALDAFVDIPNHLHGIVQIVNSDDGSGAQNAGAYCNTPLRNIDPEQSLEFRSPSQTLGAIIRGYKSAVNTRINKKRKQWGSRYGNAITMTTLFGINHH